MARTWQAVLFDFDGTLTHPDALDFARVRQAVGCPPDMTILEYIDSLPTEEARGEAHAILAEFEMAAARASVPNEGAEALVRLLRDRGIPVGILTRNTMASIRGALKNFRAVTENDFHVIITRESDGRPKPHPDGVLGAARRLGIAPRDMLVVGDYVFDIAAGKAAGASTVLITNGRAAPPSEPAPDFTIAALPELAGLLGLEPVA